MITFHGKIKDLTRQCGVLNVNYLCYLIDNDSFKRGLKVHCNGFGGGICSLRGERNCGISLRGEGIEVKYVFYTIIKRDLGEVGRNVMHPCRAKRDILVGMTGLCLEGKKGLKYYTLVGRGRLLCHKKNGIWGRGK